MEIIKWKSNSKKMFPNIFSAQKKYFKTFFGGTILCFQTFFFAPYSHNRPRKPHPALDVRNDVLVSDNQEIGRSQSL